MPDNNTPDQPNNNNVDLWNKFSSMVGGSQQQPESQTDLWNKFSAMSNPQTPSGPWYDYLFSTQPYAHILSAIGTEAESTAQELPKQTEDELTKMGVFNDYKAGEHNLRKSMSEAFIRPFIMAGAGAASLFGGAFAGINQTGQELETAAKRGVDQGASSYLTAPIGEAGQILGAVGAGEYFPSGGFPKFGELYEGKTGSPAWLNTPRAEGAIGESYPTYAGLKEPTMNDQWFRAKSTGELPAELPAPNIHDLVRQTNPDLFKQYDNFIQIDKEIKNQLQPIEDARSEMSRINEDPEATPEDLEKADTLQKFVEEKEADPDIQQAKEDLTDNMAKIIDYAPEVKSAYQDAQAKLDTHSAAQASYEARRPIDLTSDMEVPPEAREGSTTSTEAPVATNTNEIYDTEYNKLKTAGLPDEEADAAAKLVQSHYQARASRFEGKLGTAEDLYKKESPSVVSIKAKEKGTPDELRQDEAPPSNEPVDYYSALSKFISESKTKSAPADQWSKSIDNAQGLKKEEIENTGIKDWLAEQKGKVSKEAISNYLKEHQIELNETILKQGPIILSPEDKFSIDNLNNELADRSDKSQTLLDRIVQASGFGYAPNSSQIQKLAGDIENNITFAARFSDELKRLIIEADQNYDVMTVIRKQIKDIKNSYKSSKYGNDTYNLKGGKNYREILVQAPKAASDWVHSHWDDIKGVVGHVRASERELDGKKDLHASEFQSDLHSRGQAEGYKKSPKEIKELQDKVDNIKIQREELTKQLEELDTKQSELMDKSKSTLEEITDKDLPFNEWKAQSEDKWNRYNQIHAEISKIYEQKRDIYHKQGIARDQFYSLRQELNDADNIRRPPDVPFKNYWEFLFKRFLGHAVRNGFQKISWDTGDTQVNRWSDALRQNVDTIKWEKTSEGVHLIGLKDGREVTNTHQAENNISAAIGKSMAEQIKKDPNPTGVISGDNITIDHTWPHELYNVKLPAFAKKYTKKWNGEVKISDMPTGKPELVLPDVLQNKNNLLIKLYELQEKYDSLNDETAYDYNDLARRVGRGELNPSNFFEDLRQYHSFMFTKKPEELIQLLKSDLGAKISNPTTQVWSMDITPEMRKEILTKGQTLFQGNRGAFNRPENLIKLFEGKADASTIFHESAHAWLEELVRDSQHAEAPESIKQDMQTVRNWMGNKGEPITRAQHEKFARGFERYLREGVAPSSALDEVFAKLKQWLSEIYKKVSSLKAPINDDVRAVFDRLLVNDEDQTSRPVISAKEEPSPAPSINPSVNSASTVSESSAANDNNPDGTPKSPDELNQKESKFVDKQGNVRVSDLSSDEDVQQILRDIISKNNDFLRVRNGKVSATDQLNFTDAIAAPNSKTAMKMARSLAAKYNMPLDQVIFAVGKVLKQAAEDVKGFADTEDTEGFSTAVTQLTKITQTFSGLTAEWGRAGRAFQTLYKQAAEAQELNELLQTMTGRNVAQTKQIMKSVKNLKNSTQVTKQIKTAYKPLFFDKLSELTSMNYVSGPITHLYYMADNIIRGAAKAFVTTPTTAAVGSVRSALGIADKDRVSWGEAFDGMYAYRMGIPNAFKSAWVSLKLGIPQGMQLADLAESKASWEIKNGFLSAANKQTRINDLMKNPSEDMRLKSEAPQSLALNRNKAISGKLGSFVRLPGERMVSPAHSIAYNLEFHSNLARYIAKSAREEGEQKGWSSDQVTQQIAKLYYDTPIDIIEKARDEALQGSLMGKNPDFVSRMSYLLSTPVPGLGSFGRIIQPFIGMSTKQIQLLYSATLKPVVQLATPSFWKNITGGNGGIVMDRTIAETALGLGFNYAIIHYIENKYMNGSAPDNREEAIVQEMYDGSPNSVRVGEMSYSTERLGVTGGRISLLGNIYKSWEILDKNGWGGMGQNMGPAFFSLLWDSMHAIMENGPVSGISDLFNAMEDPTGNKGRQFVDRLIANLVPSAVGLGQVARGQDPYDRETSAYSWWTELLNTVKSEIPGLRETLEPKVDLFGNPVPAKVDWAIYAEKISQDPVYQALKGLKDPGHFPAPVKKTILGIHLTNEQHHEYATLAGAYLYRSLQNAITKPEFSNMSPAAQHDIIRLSAETARSAAEQVVIAHSIGGSNDIAAQATQAKINLAQSQPEEDQQ